MAGQDEGQAEGKEIEEKGSGVGGSRNLIIPIRE
jgi:hypothetical protein